MKPKHSIGPQPADCRPRDGGWLTAPLPAGEPAEIDISVAHPARSDYDARSEVVGIA